MFSEFQTTDYFNLKESIELKNYMTIIYFNTYFNNIKLPCIYYKLKKYYKLVKYNNLNYNKMK